MKNYTKTRLSILALKAKICGFQHISKALRKQACATSGPKRHLLKEKKNELGRTTRHHLAAYALMRGIPFSRLEVRCQEGNYLDPNKVLQILLEHEPYRTIEYNSREGVRTRSRWNIEAVRDLLIREEG